MLHGAAAQAELPGPAPGISTQNINPGDISLSATGSNPGPATTNATLCQIFSGSIFLRSRPTPNTKGRADPSECSTSVVCTRARGIGRPSRMLSEQPGWLGYFRASSIRLNGVSVARRNRVKPASANTRASRASPA
jgi:hypothetical protein